MHIQNKIKTHITIPTKISSIDFINNEDSFRSCANTCIKQNYVCMHYVFDENGNSTKTDLLDSVYTAGDESNYSNFFSNLHYKVVIPANNKWSPIVITG